MGMLSRGLQAAGGILAIAVSTPGNCFPASGTIYTHGSSKQMVFSECPTGSAVVEGIIVPAVLPVITGRWHNIAMPRTPERRSCFES